MQVARCAKSHILDFLCVCGWHFSKCVGSNTTIGILNMHTLIPRYPLCAKGKRFCEGASVCVFHFNQREQGSYMGRSVYDWILSSFGSILQNLTYPTIFFRLVLLCVLISQHLASCRLPHCQWSQTKRLSITFGGPALHMFSVPMHELLVKSYKANGNTIKQIKRRWHPGDQHP